MSLNFRRFIDGIQVQVRASTSADTLGEIEVVGTNLRYHNGTTVSPVVTQSHAFQGTNRLQNKDLESTTTKVVDPSDTTKKAGFSTSGATTGTTTTLTFSQTADRAITFPDADTTLVGTGVTQTLTNKTVTDNSFTIQDNSDTSKKAQFEASGISTATTRTFTFPDANTVLVGTDATQTLTNKTLSGNTATNLVSGSGTFTFNTTGTITAPNATDTLVGKATTDSLTNKTLVDNSTAIADNSDATKQIKFDAGGTTGTSSTITGAQTANRVITLPDATTTLVGTDATQTLTNKTVTDSTFTVQDDGDNTKKAQFQASGITTGTTRTFTFPDANTTLVGTDATQTLTNKTLSGNTAATLISGAGTLTLNTSGTVTVPNATDTLVGKATTDTLTNKTLGFLQTTVSTDSTATGSSATLSSFTSGVVRLTNASLVSVTGIPAGSSGQFVTVENQTGAAITILNDSGATTANRIYTGTGASVTMQNNATFQFEYDTTASRWMLVGGTGSGSGTLFPNYITFNNAEAGTQGWATYADAAGNKPVDGTGGTATGLTFSASTSSPLRGTASYSMVQANSTSLQGKGVSYDFTIDSADQSQNLAILFDYNASTTFVTSDGTTSPLFDGTTTTNAGNSDIEVFIYDVTNAQLIPVFPAVIFSKGSNNYTFSGAFATASNSTSYRLILHVATTSANATGWTFKFDNVSVSRQTSTGILNTTDWSTGYSITASAGFGTTTLNSVYSRRVGDSLEVRGYWKSGTVAASTAYIQLPTGITIDSTKMTSSTNVQMVGKWLRIKTGTSSPISSNDAWSPLFYDGSTTGQIFVGQAVASDQITKTNGNNTFASNDGFAFQFIIPVTGWSSNNQTLTVPTNAASIITVDSGNGHGSTNTKVRRFSNTRKSLGSAITYTDSSTLGGTFTINYPGIYTISYSDSKSAAGTVNFGIVVNGTALTTSISTPVTYAQGLRSISSAPGGGSAGCASWSGYLAAGDIVYAQTDGVVDVTNAECMFTICNAAYMASVAMVQPRSEIWLYQTNGYGSTNNKIRRWTTINKSIGSAITYADSSTLGGTFTINEDGVYAIRYTDQFSGSATAGISVNSTQLTTDILSITSADRRDAADSAAANRIAACQTTLNLTAGDVVRAHTDGSASGTNTTAPSFRITKVSS